MLSSPLLALRERLVHPPSRAGSSILQQFSAQLHRKHALCDLSLCDGRKRSLDWCDTEKSEFQGRSLTSSRKCPFLPQMSQVHLQRTAIDLQLRPYDAPRTTWARRSANIFCHAQPERKQYETELFKKVFGEPPAPKADTGGGVEPKN